MYTQLLPCYYFVPLKIVILNRQSNEVVLSVSIFPITSLDDNLYIYTSI